MYSSISLCIVHWHGFKPMQYVGGEIMQIDFWRHIQIAYHILQHGTSFKFVRITICRRSALSISFGRIFFALASPFVLNWNAFSFKYWMMCLLACVVELVTVLSDHFDCTNAKGHWKSLCCYAWQLCSWSSWICSAWFVLLLLLWLIVMRQHLLKAEFDLIFSTSTNECEIIILDTYIRTPFAPRTRRAMSPKSKLKSLLSFYVTQLCN